MMLTQILTSCGFKSDTANGGLDGLAKYKARVANFVEGMKKLEYISVGQGAGKYMSDDQLFENLMRNVVAPARFIISDYEMPDMKGTRMCQAIREHFAALTAKLVNNQTSDPAFADIQSCVPAEQMSTLLSKFKPITVIVSAFTSDAVLQQDVKDCQIDYV